MTDGKDMTESVIASFFGDRDGRDDAGKSADVKSGFVAILGSPNVGKSTLMNAFVGAKIAIVSEKAQTTRNRIAGVVTKEGYQIVFLDTPGIHEPRTKLGEYMVKTAYSAGRDVDVILMLIDAKKGIMLRDKEIISRLDRKKLIAAVNKKDLVSKETVSAQMDLLRTLGADTVFALSAKYHEGVQELEKEIVDRLPFGPKYYPDDMQTDMPERFIASELIREKMLTNLRDEVPHGVGIEIEKFEEQEEITNISAVIYCERESHKGTIIGRKGSMLKKIGTEARLDLEMLTGTKVFLELFVKVKEGWRNSNFMLKELGYSNRD